MGLSAYSAAKYPWAVSVSPAGTPSPSATPPTVGAAQVVAYQLGPFSFGADSPIGQLLGGAAQVSDNYASGLGFLQSHPSQATAQISQNAADFGGGVGQIAGVGVNAIGSAGGGILAGVGLGVGQGAATLGAGIGSGVSQAGPGVGLGIGSAASGVGSGIGSAAVAAGPGVGMGVGAAGAGIGTGLGEALPTAGSGVGYGAGQALSGLGSAIGNGLSGIFTGGGGSSGFGLVSIALLGLLLLLILAR